MSEDKVLSAIIGTVPQWYTCGGGPETYTLTLNDCKHKFYSHRPLTPNLSKLLDFARITATKWNAGLPAIPTPSSIAKIKEEMVLKWLEIHDETVHWNKLIAYAEELHFRTHENASVSMNLVISGGEGSLEITTSEIQKILDPLASSQQTYIRVDKQLRFLDYSYVKWSEVEDSSNYKFNPEFLQPFRSTLGTGDFSFHLTSRGDIVIMDQYGVLCTCRKGQWYIYDVSTFKNSIVGTLGSYAVGCNIFEIVLDLSYRRHGALLIFDPNHQVLSHVVNKSSIIYT